MSNKNSDNYSHEEQMKKIINFTQAQHDKAAELIKKAQENMADFSQPTLENDINEQTNALIQSVNGELDKAMAVVDKKMEVISQ